MVPVLLIHILNVLKARSVTEILNFVSDQIQTMTQNQGKGETRFQLGSEPNCDSSLEQGCSGTGDVLPSSVAVGHAHCTYYFVVSVST